MRGRLVPALAATAALLIACDARVGNEAGEGGVTAENKAKEGQITIDADGFELKIDIPQAVRERAGMDGDSRLLPPGAELAGLHVAAREDEAGGDSHGEVEIRFTATEAPQAVTAWYRDPARSGDLTLSSVTREGEAILLAGTGVRDGEAFRVRLAPRPGGGTDGRLLLSDTHRQ